MPIDILLKIFLSIRLVANLDKLVESENFSLVETSLLGNNSILINSNNT